MSTTHWLVVGLLFLFPFRIIAQAEDVIEKLLERNEQVTDLSDIIEDNALPDLNPVNLNTAEQNDLSRIPGFTDKRIRSFLVYRKNYGEILSMNELVAIQGFDTSFIQSLVPYIFIEPLSKSPPITFRNLAKLTRHQLLLRVGQIFPKSAGYILHDTSLLTAGYPGSPQRCYFRYTAAYYDRLQIGFAGEKDPGEQFFAGAQPLGMDYYAGYIAFSGRGWLKNIVVGNFRAGFGQGLTFGTGLSGGTMPGFTPGNITLGCAKGSLSMSEGNYLQGITATIRIKRLQATGFFSRHRRDGNITLTDTTTGETTEFSSLQGTGLHRTESELKDRNSISELVTGGNINFTGEYFRIGITGYYLRWSGILAGRAEPYKLFNFSGRENFGLGADFQVKLRKAYLFGEISRSANGGIAWLAGLTASPDPGVKITCLARDYHADYQNLFSNSFGQQSINANEQGVFFNITAGLFSKLTLAAYADLFRFPWLKYGIDSPSEGFECGIQLTSPVNRQFNIALRWLYNCSPASLQATGIAIPATVAIRRQNLRTMLVWNPLPSLLLKTRFETNMTRSEGEGWQYGYLFYQDISFKPGSIPAGIIFRYALFDVPGYAQRIYTYEPEVLFGYSVPAFYGNGYRICLMVNGKITRYLNWWVRGALTKYHDRSSIGSGLDEITGDKKYELSVQLMFRL